MAARKLGCLPSLVLLLVLGAAGWLVIVAVTDPWIFTVGGRTRLIPFWEGEGEAPGPGGTYRLFVSLYPIHGGSRIRPTTTVNGRGWICAPGGRNYPIALYGHTDALVWADMNGRPFWLKTWASRGYGVVSYAHNPPQLALAGRWDGPDLSLEDGGALAGAFNADGSLIAKPTGRGASVVFRIVEHRWWFGDPCG